MSEPARRTEANVRRTRWPGWIWAVPIAAVIIVGWLAVRALAKGGEHVTVMFDQAAGAKAGDTHVTYRGLQVGEVADVKLTKDGRHVRMKLRLDKSVKPFLRTGTRFWLVGANPSLSNLKSLTSVISGPTIGMWPGPGKPSHDFVGLDRPPTLKTAPQGPMARYLVEFGGAVGGLDKGAPVTLRGFKVGKVEDVRLVYHPDTGALDAPVVIAIDPARVGLKGGQAAMDAAMTRWVGQGLRASLAKTPPLVGAAEVSLDFAPRSASAALQPGGTYSEIPAAGSADIGQLTAKADRILTKIDALPIDRIGRNVKDATAHLRSLVASPKLTDSIDHLDSSLRQVDQTIHQVSPQIGPLVKQLRRTADAADETAKAADQLVGGSATSQNSDLPAALHELTEAARSIRSMADYLDRHPEALIKGRKGGKR